MADKEQQGLNREPTSTTRKQNAMQGTQTRIDQREEAAKAIRFMIVKAAIFILIPVVASALAVYFLL